MKQGFLLLALLALAAPAPAADDWRARVEADWLTQDVTRSDLGRSITTQQDALGACDGVKDGKWGFHTSADEKPWWQVDLGEARPLARVLVFNRCDIPERLGRLVLLLSDDAKEWREAYRHDGTPFLGATDGKPLSIALAGAKARFVRIQLPHAGFLHLDEVEVYATRDEGINVALGQPADQSSISQWSFRHRNPKAGPVYPVAEIVRRGRRLVADLRAAGVDTRACERTLGEVAEKEAALPADAPEARKALLLRARWAIRRLALANPLLEFDRILFVKRVPGSYSHMSDQNYGWWSRPGGGLYLLEGFRTGAPRERCLTPGLPPGSANNPDLSYDGKRVLFAWCRHYPHLAGLANKVEKEKIPEDAFYHLFEMNVDGTGLRQVTRGRYDDFDARYLPSGEIAFLSTRRGQFVQCSAANAMATTRATLPDSYVRCGGGRSRPVAVYTLHVMDARGGNLRALSPFENFEWTPSVAEDGRLLYARWDYVDRDNMPYMSLWSTNPDGTNPQIVYGNFTRSPHCIFEARGIPGSRKLLFTASGHHSITAGSLVLLDPTRGVEGPAPLTRLTPDVCFPVIVGGPANYYANPYPLSERYFLTAWSHRPISHEGGPNPPNALGLYLYDAFGNLELLSRDPEISSVYPLPVRPRGKPRVVAPRVAWNGAQEGRFLLLDVYQGLPGVLRGAVERLRIVAMPAKTQPEMNSPVLGVTKDDPGKCVLGTVPVEKDGSAYFRVPSGVPVFFQALDGEGKAVQTMRSLTYLQPGETLSCVGCHEGRNATPPKSRALAGLHAPSRIAPGPEGSWPLRFDHLVQPLLDRSCVSCHRAGGANPAAAALDLTPARAYESLIGYGRPSLREHVLARYREGRSPAGAGPATTSPLLALLCAPAGHHGVCLDAGDRERLVTWMDTYAQRLGSYSAEQETELRRLRLQCGSLLE